MTISRFAPALLFALPLLAPRGSAAEETDRLAAILVAGDDWQVAADGLGFADGPSCDADGNFYFSDMRAKAVFRIAPDGTKARVFDTPAALSGTRFGPDGRLYACGGGRLFAFEMPGGGATELTDGVAQNDLVVTHQGHIYYTETSKKQVSFFDPKTGTKRAADVGIKGPNGIALSPDQSTLAVSDYLGVNVWTFRIQPDGTLADKKPAMTMRTPENKPAVASGDGMTTDTAGRYYVTTAVGLQVFDPGGELLGVVPTPKGPLTSCGFGGASREILYILCGSKVYKRRTQVRGALFFQPPLPAPGKP
jgi:sugar lactone lactonase YvrE